VTLALFEQVVVPALQTWYVNVPWVFFASWSTWLPSFAVVTIFALLRKMSTFVPVAPVQLSVDFGPLPEVWPLTVSVYGGGVPPQATGFEKS
jgi:hypothetical protein